MKRLIGVVVMAVGWAWAVQNAAGQAGTLDTSFAAGGHLMPNGWIRCITVQTNGSILIGGEFTRMRYGSVTNHGIARLNADGTVDTTFRSLTGFPNIVYNQLSSDNGPHCLAAQSDGKILAGGAFSMYRGLSRRILVRINADGTPDPSFNADLQGNAVECLLIQPDGKILIGGDLATVGGVRRTGIARLNTNGVLDTSFIGCEIDGRVNDICRRSDGRLLITGSFKKADYLNRPYVAMLNTNGTLVDSFYQDVPTPLGTYGALAAALRPDQRLLVGGDCSILGGTVSNQYLTSLNAADGTVDASFTTGNGPNNVIKALAVQADGRILVGGSFANFNGTGKHHFLRLWPDGFVDASLSYTNGTGTGWTFLSQDVEDIAIVGDQALICGSFEKYENNTNFPGLARINLGTITPIPHAPVITEGERVLVPMSEDADPTPFALTLHATDSNSDLLTWYCSTPARHGVVSVSGTGNSKAVSYTPGSGFHGEDDFAVCVYDPSGGTDVITVNVDVRGLHAYRAGGLVSEFCDYERGINWCVSSLALAPNGQIIIGGDFTQIDQSWRWGIARLERNGTVDGSFDPDYGFKVSPPDWGKGPLGLAALPDGKILVGGNFAYYDEEYLSGNTLIRLLPSGARDTNFNPAVQGTVQVLAVQTNGRIIVAGDVQKVGGVWCWGIARLNADGTRDPSFDSGDGPDGKIYAVTLQPDGKILIGGTFSSYDGYSRSRVARLLPDGSVDPAWLGSTTITGGPPEVYSIALQSDGKVILGGQFLAVNGLTQKNLARLNANGTMDGSFVKMANSAVHAVAVQADDKILVGGAYASVSDRGSAWYTSNYPALMRLERDGNLDTSFMMDESLAAIEYPPFNWVKTLMIVGDRVLVGGDFTHYQGVRRRRLLEIHLVDQPPLEIDGIQAAAGGRNVSWTYFPETDGRVSDPIVNVQATTNMIGGHWTTLLQTNLSHAAKAVQFISNDPGAAAPQRYYRLKREE